MERNNLNNKTDNLLTKNRNGFHWLVIPILLFSDLAGLYTSFYLASYLRKLLIPWIGGVVYWPVYLPVVYLGMLLTVVLFAFNDLYPGYGLTSIIEIKKVSKSLTLVYGFLGVSVYFLKTNTDFPRSIFLIAWVLSIGMVTILRIIIRNIASLSEWYGTPVYVILQNDRDISTLESLKRCRRMGWKPRAVFLLEESRDTDHLLGVPVFDSLAPLLDRKHPQSVNRVIVQTSIYETDDARIQKIIRELTTHFESVVLVSPSYELGSVWVEPRDLEGRLGLELNYHLIIPGASFVKRVTDIVGSILSLLLTFPLWIIIAILIKLDSQGSVFYKHQRIGNGGEKIEMLKFRTMHKNADQELEDYINNHPEAKKEWEEKHKLRDDPRLTGVGKWLRKFSLDELPQFWNVLRGDMSLIGPRPVTAKEVEDYGEYASIILRVKPGITGWWQVMGRNQTSWEERMRLEVYYVSNWSLWMDAYIILKTVWVIISGQGR